MTRWLALLLAGCTGAPASSTASTDAAEISGQADTARDVADVRAAAVHEIVVTASGFLPFETTIAVGDAIMFRWGTETPTSVISGFACTADGLFASPPLREPSTWRLRFPVAGPFPMFVGERCDQVGIIVVE